MDTLDFTPKGFTRWERDFARARGMHPDFGWSSWDIKVADDAALQTVYLANTSDLW